MTTRFVLVEPRVPGNIGAAARAMWTMGFQDLSLVAPAVSPIDPKAVMMAVEAEFLLKKTVVLPTLKEAVSDCHWVVGTTRRLRRYEKEYLDPKEFALWRAGLPENENIAILFGTEDNGLSNESIQICHKLVSIPTQGAFGSLNLAQSVQILAYELFCAGRKPEEKKMNHPPATMEELEGMYQHLQDLLSRVGFLNAEHPEHPLQILRAALNRTALTYQEVQLIRGLCRQIDWALNRPSPYAK